MADFCKQCHDELFPPVEVYDFEGLITEAESAQGMVVAVLCEGCGHTYVNHKGECVNPHCEEHGGENVSQ